MFAILINEENLPKITERYGYPSQTTFDYDLFINSRVDCYMISGYVTSRRGTPTDWAIVPAYILDINFEYDPIKVKTDWVQIVRKL